jgi:hypothetical protein
MNRMRMWAAGLAVAALGVILVAQGGRAGENKEVVAAVDKIAEAFKKGSKDAAKQEGQALAKKTEELLDVMDLLRPRQQGGVGVGDKPGAIIPDGIEQMLLKIGRDAPPPGTLNKDAGAYEQMAYRLAAIAEVAIAKAPDKDMGKKLKKDWITWSSDMRDAALELSAAAKSKSGAAVKSAASKLNNSCNSCHSIYR